MIKNEQQMKINPNYKLRSIAETNNILDMGKFIYVVFS